MSDPKTETVTISKKEYLSLLEDRNMLTALENAGVDNWNGYDYAMETFEQLQNGEDE